MQKNKENSEDVGMKNDKIKILIVDDEPMLLESCKILITKRFGYECEATDDYRKAINIAKNDNIDILIVDYLLVEVTGIHIVNKVRETNKKIYIILNTGHLGLVNALDALEKYDIDSFSQKDGSLDDLFEKIAIGAKSVKKMRSILGTSSKDKDNNEFVAPKNLAEKIRYLRVKNGFTQEQLAEVLEVTRSSVANYETNVSQPNVKQLQKLSEHFRISVDYLISDDDSADKY